MMEAMLLLATIAQRFRFTWQSEYPATPFPSITLRAQDRMWMKVVGHTAYSGSRYEGINLPLDARLFDLRKNNVYVRQYLRNLIYRHYLW